MNREYRGQIICCYTLIFLTGCSPNIFPKQNTNQNILIVQGISSHNVALNTLAGLFADDINYPIICMQNPDLLDVERVEILRSLQGTLYGRNTEFGVVKIVTASRTMTSACIMLMILCLIGFI